MGKPRTTILIAEDSPDEVFLLRYAFKNSGLKVELQFVANGQEAIDYLEGKPPYGDPQNFPIPAAVILDIKMPMVSGLEVLVWLSEHPSFSNLPAVIHTSSVHDKDRAEAARLGARAYYVKSGHQEDLVAMLREIAERFVLL